MNVSTDPHSIEEVLSRGVSAIYPTEHALKDALASGKRLRVYLGIDATGSQLHLGHATKLAALERFRRLGHEAILLFGDFTAMIGDPTDKTATRTRLSKEEVEENISRWRDQAKHYIALNDPDNPALIRRNSEWLATLSFEDVVNLASEFTVQQMIERDMFENRLKERKPIYVHEFMYPLMQGYDSVALDVDIEIGGTDQTFNMLAGRTLLNKRGGKEKYVVALELLEDPATGRKLMSKSEGDYVPLDAPAAELYGGVMAVPDGAIVPLLRDATFVSMEVVDEATSALAGGANPRDIKMQLAHTIVSLIYDDTTADAAQESFVTAFQKRDVPSDVPTIAAGDSAADSLVAAGIIASKSELRRLFTQGAIEDTKSGDVLREEDELRGKTIRIGKHRFVHIS